MPAAASGLRGGFRVDELFGQVRQLLVRGLLLVQRLLGQPGRVRPAQTLRVGADGAVPGDLVMLDALGGGDEGRVLDVRVPLLRSSAQCGWHHAACSGEREALTDRGFEPCSGSVNRVQTGLRPGT